MKDWRGQTKSLPGFGAVADLKIILNDENGLPERHTVTRITPNSFRLLGVRPTLGRDFQEADELPGAPPVAILTYAFWERSYAKDLNIIGRTLRMHGAPPVTVIGVMPAGFSFPQNQDFWIPLIETPDLERRDARSLWFAFSRMPDGVTRQKVQTEMETIGDRLAAAYPATNQGQMPRVETFSSFFVGSNASLIFGSIFGAVGLVLLIACANLANLALARWLNRSREISVHIALGAPRWRIIRQAMLESLALACIGGFFGWLLARAGIRAYELAANPSASDWNYNLLNYAMDYHALGYCVALTIGAAVLFGVAPALRISAVGPRAGLNSPRPLAGGLVVAEVALATALLAGAGVMVRSFLVIANADVGARLDGTIEMLLHFPEQKYASADARNSFVESLKARLESIPGIEAASIGLSPAGGVPPGVPYEASDSEPVDANRRPTTVTMTISRDYFKTLGATLLSGRDFNLADGPSGVPVAIVNQRFASQQWPGQDAIGRRLRIFSRGQQTAWLTVVGLASNIVYDRTRQEISPVIYLPATQSSRSEELWVLARSAVPAAGLSSALRRETAAIDPDVVIWLGPYDLGTPRGGPYANIRNHALLLLMFAGVALVLAALGLYTVLAFSVSHRTRELGVRIAIGATAKDIVALVLSRGMLQVAVGLGLGLIASLAVNRVLRSELVRVAPSDPLTLIITSATLVLAALAGCLIPARRAIRVDPNVALRHE